MRSWKEASRRFWTFLFSERPKVPSSVPDLPATGVRHCQATGRMIVDDLRWSEITERTLVAAGWRGTARNEWKSERNRLEAAGYECSAAASRFLERFGGLSLSWVDGTNLERSLHTHAEKAVRHAISKNIILDSLKAGSKLCPVGESHNEHMTMMIAPDGSIYLGMDDVLLLAGRSSEEAFDSIVLGHEMTEVFGD